MSIRVSSSPILIFLESANASPDLASVVATWERHGSPIVRAGFFLAERAGRSGRAEGEVLNVLGQILNLSGEPVRNATVGSVAGQRSWALHASQRSQSGAARPKF